MIDFMVLAAPRSGTTWAANWLTTEHTICLHDPLYIRAPEDLDAIHSDRPLGIACTGLVYFPEWVNRHPARKVILRREPAAVNGSLKSIGVSPCETLVFENLQKIEGRHVPYTDLFTNPKELYEFLTQRPFDAARHQCLRDMHIQPYFDSIEHNPEVIRKLMARIETTLKGD